MNKEETDENLILSYREGGIEKFKVLIERYSSPLFNFTAHLSNKDIAPDIVQETFIKAWSKLNNFNFEKSSFKTWIFNIAKNTTIDFLRKKKSINFTDLENKEGSLFYETIPDEEKLPDESLQKIQDKEFLNKLLEKLSLEHKTVLILHYQEEMTFDEIGKVLNKPLNTVKSYHHRAILKLRTMIIY